MEYISTTKLSIFLVAIGLIGYCECGQQVQCNPANFKTQLPCPGNPNICITHESVCDLANDCDDISEENFCDQLWPGGVVPYQISGGKFTARQRNIIADAFRHIEDNSCIQFEKVRLATSSDGTQVQSIVLKNGKQVDDIKEFLLIKKDDGDVCFAEHGRNVRNVTRLTLSDICFQRGSDPYRGTIVRGLAFALGLVDEHRRPNRDQFLSINRNNLRDDESNINLDKFRFEHISTSGLPYDYASIMHVPLNAFSKTTTLQTFEATNQASLNQQDVDPLAIGRSEKLSNFDIIKLNRLYKCT